MKTMKRVSEKKRATEDKPKRRKLTKRAADSADIETELPFDEKADPDDLVAIIKHDIVNEQVCIAAALVDRDQRKALVSKLRTEQFLADEHRPMWEVIRTMARKGLDFDPATISKLNPAVDVSYLSSLVQARPEVPPNLPFHVEHLLWDHARLSAVKGPIAALIKSIRNPNEHPDKVKNLARAVSLAFDGYQDRQYLHDPQALVDQQIADIKERRNGRAIFPYGAGFDKDENDNQLAIPGAAPGMVTVVTGVSGSGKSTLAANMALGLARQRRKVLYGAWEVKGGLTLELIACISLGYSRSALMAGKVTDKEIEKLRERMLAISRYVQFMSNPFRGKEQRKRYRENEERLDVLNEYITTSGCDVFFGDLFRRCLANGNPDEEEFALYEFQDMCDRGHVHGIVLQQQNLKQVEGRADKQPSRDTIKGTGAYAEVADTIIGVNRPALWRNVEDTTMDVLFLKQRWGKWPLKIETDWDGDRGSIKNGRLVQFEHSSRDLAEGSETPFDAPVSRKSKKR